jgi:UDP-glucose 4-epimerase
MARYLLNESVGEVRIFSRDENKQDQMRNEFSDERILFYIGDVREYQSVASAIRGSDYVFHAAALKQVPSCEFFPGQAVATNIDGSMNVMEASFNLEIKGLVCLSTDKAVYPINAMGMTKALMEKVAQSYARNNPNSRTKIAITRYGNVMMSRGSVIPLFVNQINQGLPVTVTNPSMTRFMMSLEESVSLVKYAFTNASPGDLFVRKAPACTVGVLIEALALILGQENNITIQNIGPRHGEKLFESLLGEEEGLRSIDHGDYFQVPLDSRSLDYQIYFEKGNNSPPKQGAFTSHNTKQLDKYELAGLLKALPEFQKLLGSV